MKLAYRAFDRSGKEVSGTAEAASPAEATAQLRGKGLFVSEIAAAGAAGAPSAGGGAARERRVSSRHLKTLTMFTRQLYVLVRSGTPLAQALGAIQKQIGNESWQAVVADLRESLEAGCSLSVAMEPHGEYFDPIYRGLVTAGESSGKLAAMLERLAVLTAKSVHVRTTVRGAMVYPCLLVTVATAVLTLLLLLVVPRFAELFRTMDVPLPPTTRMMIAVSGALRGYWWAMLGGAAAGVLGLRYYLRTPAGRRARDTAMLRLPRVGGITRSFLTARIVRLLGVLLDSHVPVLMAMRLTRGATSNWHYMRHMAAAEEMVSQGQPISATFENSPLFSPSVCEATRSGEKSGDVGSLLLNLADFLDDENEVLLKVLTSIIEPLILVVMGIVVGLVAMSMFIPLFDLTAMTGGGPS